jgi:ubiquinone/menaquinone biosynthesis C-methylase UbiE
VFLRENEIGERIAPWVEPGMRLLDLGSGTGRIADWLARRRGIQPTMADLVEYPNRTRAYPFLKLDDPVKLPADDDAFDAVMLLFVLHHMPAWDDQERLVEEVARVASRRVILIEDTPLSRIDRAFNVAWDWVLNRRHGVPTPFTFRDVAGWRAVFGRAGLAVRHAETYRPLWPTLGTYRHTLFVLDP